MLGLDVDRFFLITNGSTLIPLVAAVIGLGFYILDNKQRRKVGWREFICRPLPGIALAMPMIGVKIGFLMTRSSFWFWYNKPVTWISIVSTSIGNALIILSLLWLVAVITRPRLGEWGWRVTLVALLFYIASEFTEPGA
jgi:hypothetical protein